MNGLPDDARRILGAYNRAVMEQAQATVLRETAFVTTGPAPQRSSSRSVYFGSPEEMRGIPAVGEGCGGGAVGGSRPGNDAGRAAEIMTELPRYRAVR